VSAFASCRHAVAHALGGNRPRAASRAPLSHRPVPVIAPPVADQARLARPHQLVVVQNTDERQDHFLKDRYLQHVLIRPGARVEIDMLTDEIAVLHNLSRTDRGHYLAGPRAGQPFKLHLDVAAGEPRGTFSVSICFR
jgi:hypothetical protein